MESFELTCSGWARIRRLLYTSSNLVDFSTWRDDFDWLLLLLLCLLTLYQLLNITLQYLIHTASFARKHLFLLLLDNTHVRAVQILEY